MESAGVGIVLSPKAQAVLIDFNQINGRIMTITLQTQAGKLNLVNAYAPQSGLNTEQKNNFYQQLEQTIHAFANTEITYILGDFNARIQHRFNHESHFMGKHIFGRGQAYLRGVANATQENRDLFTEFCASNDIHIMNTYFAKPSEKQVTFKETETEHGPPWTPTRYAQIDFVLSPHRWKNGVQDVESNIKPFPETDHYVLESTIRIKLKKKNKQLKQIKRYRKPTEEEQTKYNEQLLLSYSTSEE